MVALRGAHHDVLWAIVGSVAVYVVYHLGSGQVAAERLFSHKPMFVDPAVLICAWVTIWGYHGDVAIRRQRASTIPSWIPRAALMVAQHVQRTILASSSNNGSTPASAEHGHGAISRLRISKNFFSILQVVRVFVGRHNRIVTHAVYYHMVAER